MSSIVTTSLVKHLCGERKRALGSRGTRAGCGEQTPYLLRADSIHGHAFSSAALARKDSNSGHRHIQTRSEQAAQGQIGLVVHRGRGEAYLEGSLPLAVYGLA